MTCNYNNSSPVICILDRQYHENDTNHLRLGSTEGDKSAIRQSNTRSSSGNPWRGNLSVTLRIEVKVHKHPHPRYVCNIARIFSQQGSPRRKSSEMTQNTILKIGPCLCQQFCTLPEDRSVDWADELPASTSPHPPPLLLHHLPLRSHRRAFPYVSTI